MNKERGFDYFEAYARQAAYAYELACNLESSLTSKDFGSRELADALHTIENDADEVCHKIHSNLLTDFVVPFERGSMSALANAIDDVSDAVEDVAMQAYYFHCEGILPAGREMVSLVVGATRSFANAIESLDARLGRMEEVRERLVEVQDAESACDRIYIDALHELYGETGVDAEQRRIAHAMLAAIEKSSDAVESAAEQLEAIVAENA